MRTAAALIVLALCASVATADDESGQPAGNTLNLEPVTGVRYRVRLRNGGELVGVVRGASVFERRGQGGAYEPSDQDDPEAGLRLWFPLLQDGFIFVPVKAVERLDEVGALSVSEGRSIAKARVAARERADAERAVLRAVRAAELSAEVEAEAKAKEHEEETSAKARAAAAEDEAAGAPDGEAGETAPAMSEAERTAARRKALLERFPLTRWKPETPAEIQRRKVVLGLFPSDDERAFLESFDEWSKARDEHLRQEAARKAAAGDGAGSAAATAAPAAR